MAIVCLSGPDQNQGTTTTIKINYDLVLFVVDFPYFRISCHSFCMGEERMKERYSQDPRISDQFRRFGAKNAPILATSDSKRFFCISSTA